jgi:hypothetical protein
MFRRVRESRRPNCFGLFDQLQHARILPDLTVVGLDATDDWKDDSDDSEESQEGNSDDHKSEEHCHHSVDEHTDKEVHDVFAVDVDGGKFILFELPYDNGGDETSERQYIACENGEVEQHAPVTFGFVHGVCSLKSAVNGYWNSDRVDASLGANSGLDQHLEFLDRDFAMGGPSLEIWEINRPKKYRVRRSVELR